MKLQIIWFCFILLTNRVSITSAESFVSCSSYFYDDDFFVQFDCAFLDDKMSHRNYFDKNVISNVCNTTKSISIPFSSATTIRLTNCRLPNLPHHFLQRLEHAETIQLNGCGITAIDNGILSGGLIGLSTISMSQNGLTELPGFLFSQTPNISELNLSLNRISHIDPNTFRGTVKRLKIVNLSHNNIETIDKQLFMDAINLVELDLGHNFIEQFRVDLSKMKDLTVLSLDNNKITKLDCTIFDLTTNTINILVNYNHIREVDLNCSNAQLESLDLILNDNQLTHLTFPKSNLLNGLAKLRASRNHIESITFQQPFRQLTHLHLNANNLKDLFGWDEAMFPKLEYLDITSNQFNCSYASVFLKQLPKTIDLERFGGRSDTSDSYSYSEDLRHTSKRSRMIHGINCIDGVVERAFETDHTDDVERIIIRCLLMALSAVLFVALISMKVGKMIKKCRSNRAESISVRYQS